MPIRLKYGAGAGYRGSSYRGGGAGLGATQAAQLGLLQQEQEWSEREKMQRSAQAHDVSILGMQQFHSSLSQAASQRHAAQMQAGEFAGRERYARNRAFEEAAAADRSQSMQRRDLMAAARGGTLGLSSGDAAELEKADRALRRLEKDYGQQVQAGGGDYHDYLQRKKILQDQIDSVLAKSWKPPTADYHLRQAIPGYTPEEYPGVYEHQGRIGQLVSKSQVESMKASDLQAAEFEKRAKMLDIYMQLTEGGMKDPDARELIRKFMGQESVNLNGEAYRTP